MATSLLAPSGPRLSRAGAGSPPSRPNVLIVVTDDQRVGTLDVMPAVRRHIASAGINFKNAFATTPLCCPSRASIFTGQYAHNHGVHRIEWRRMPHRDSLERYLNEVGYRTAIYGKFLNGWPVELRPPYWDRYSIFAPDGYGYYNATFSENGTPKVVETNSTRYIARKGMSFIRDGETDDDRPWLLYLAPFAPHCPCVPQEKYAEVPLPPFEETPAMLEVDRSDKPRFVRETSVSRRRVERTRDGQLRTLMTADDLVENVFRQLSENGETDNTLVFFVSDNGYLWGEHGLLQKALPYTESIEIPLLMRWPAGGVDRAVDRRLVANIDIMPTILDAASLPLPDTVDGHSLLGDYKRGRMLTEAWGARSRPWAKWASIRTRKYQYVEYYEEAGEAVLTREYYDLVKDPWQLHNLFGDDRAGNDPPLRPLKRRLTADRTCAGDACP